MAISWFSKKQNCVALSTAEAEYIAAAASAQDLVNLKGVLLDFQINSVDILYCDNKSSISMSKCSENSKRAKHIDIRNHYLKDLVFEKVISVEYVPTEQNLADMLTKPLGKDRFVDIVTNLNIK